MVNLLSGSSFNLINLILSVVGTLVAVAALWYAFADHSPKSLVVRQISLTALQPKHFSDISIPGVGLTISVNGVPLVNPYSVVFEIKNDGSKPVITSDFETPVGIILDLNPAPELLPGVKKQSGAGVPSSVAQLLPLWQTQKPVFAMWQITSTEPKGMDAQVIPLESGLALKPMLLNPGDSVTFAAVTSGGPPKFDPRGRIVGVTKIDLIDGAAISEKPSFLKQALLFMASSFLLITSMIATPPVLRGYTILLRPRAARFIEFGTLTVSMVISMVLFDSLGIQGFWPPFVTFVSALIPAFFIARLINPQSIKSE